MILVCFINGLTMMNVECILLLTKRITYGVVFPTPDDVERVVEPIRAVDNEGVDNGNEGDKHGYSL